LNARLCPRQEATAWQPATCCPRSSKCRTISRPVAPLAPTTRVIAISPPPFRRVSTPILVAIEMERNRCPPGAGAGPGEGPA
jgi:hypothetical protein